MSIALKQPILIEPLPQSRFYQFSVEQYHRMVASGILTEDDRVELLKGWIIKKMSHNPPHESSITRINRYLIPVLPLEWVLRVQASLTLADSEPEPDFAIAQGPDEKYSKRHPVARDIALLIEVADSSLLKDRRDKGLLYAQNQIPEYWIINLAKKKGGSLYEVGEDRLRDKREYAKDELVPLVLGNREIASIPVKNLLP